MFTKLKKACAAVTLVTMMQWTFGIPVSLILSLLDMKPAFAATTVQNFSAGTTGISGTSGAVTGWGDEAGSHSIAITDSSVALWTGADAESNTLNDTIASSLAGDEMLSFTLCGQAITTAALNAATANTTSLLVVGADIETKINAAASVCDVLVGVGGASPNKYFVIRPRVVGTANEATGLLNNVLYTGQVNGGGTETGLATGVATAGVDAKAIDTFTAAAGAGVTTNGEWVTAKGNPFSLPHQPAAGTASTLAGLKIVIGAADAIVQGLTLTIAGALTTGTASFDINAPRMTAGNIGVDVSGCAGGVCNIGESVKVTWDNSAGGDDNAAALYGVTISSVKVNLSEFGGGVATDMNDSGTNGDTSGGDNIWSYSYTLTETDINTADADAIVTAYDDASASNYITVTKESNTSVDTDRPAGTVTKGTATLKDSDLVQEVTVTYDEDMAPASTPTITFGTTTGTWTPGAGSWSTVRIWLQNFTLTDSGEERTAVTIASSAATDASGNAEGTSTQTTFNIDTLNPSISVGNIIGTTVPAGNDTIAITFSEAVTELSAENPVNWVIESPDGTPLTETTATWVYVGTTLTITLDEATDGMWLTNSNIVAVTPTASVVDLNGNAIAAAEVVGTTLISGDVAVPTLTSATLRDLDGDGKIDAADLVFNEKMLDTSFVAANWTFTGTAATGFDTLATANDQTIRVLYATDNLAVNTAATGATLVFTVGNTANDLAGNDLAAIADVTESDGAAAIPIAQVYKDTNDDGQVDRVDVTFSEAITLDEYDAADWSFPTPGDINLGAETNAVASGSDIQISVTGDASETGGTVAPTVSYDSTQGTANSVHDADNNNVVSVGPLTVADNAKPRIESVTETDENGDGKMDRAVIVFTEAVTDASVAFADFTMGGTAFTSFTTGVANDDTATFDIAAGVTGTEKKEIVYTAGTLTDASAALNAAITQTFLAAGVTDSAGPAILSAVAADVAHFDGIDAGDTVTITFSENTNKPVISAANINTVLDLTGANSWLDGASAIGSASWNLAGNILTVTLSVGTSDPTVAVGHTITTDGATITDGTTASSVVASPAITGSFNDLTPPVLSTLVTGDNDSDGTVDRLVATFDEDLVGTMTGLGFTVAGSGCSLGSSSETSAGVITIVLTGCTAGNTSILPTLAYSSVTGDITDNATALNELATFSATAATDGAEPAILSSVTGDNDGDGTVDRLVLTFSESVTLTDGGTDDDFTLVASSGTATIDAGTYGIVGTTFLTYNVTPSATGNTSLTIAPTYATAGAGSVIDGSANEMLNGETVAGTDGAIPAILSAVTGDNDSDGQVDRLVLTFSEQVDIADGAAGDGFDGLTLSSHAIANSDYAASNTTTMTLFITESGSADTNATINPTYTTAGAQTIIDNSALEMVNAETVTGTDGAKPAIISAVTGDNNGDATVDRLVLTFSEAADVTDGNAGDGFPAITLVASAGVATIANADYATSGTTLTLTLSGTDAGNTALTITPTYVVANAGQIDDQSAANNEMADTETVAGTDGAAARVLSITSSTGNGAYNVPDAINVTVTLSEAVTLVGGTLDVTLDTTDVIAIAAFGPSATPSGTYTVGAGDTSADLDSTAIALNGGTLLDAALISAIIALPATTIADGSAIIIDTTAPTVVLTDDHVDSIVRDADTVVVTATFTETGSGIDETPVPTIAINYSAGGCVDIGATNMTISTNLIWTYSWNVPAGSACDGSATLSIVAADEAGNSSTAATGQTVYTVDNTAPTVDLTDDHVDSFVMDSDTVNITATFTEANGIEETPAPTISIDNAGGCADIAGDAMVMSSNLVWTYAWDVPTGAGCDGASAVSITATDEAGNANDAATGQTAYTVDNTAPTSSIVAINSYYNTSTVVVSVTNQADAGSGVASVSLYSCQEIVESSGCAVYALVSTDSSAPYAWTFDFTTNGEGRYYFYSRATDVAGNVEAAPGGADDTTIYDISDPVSAVTTTGNYNAATWVAAGTEIDGTATDVDGVLPISDINDVNITLQRVYDNKYWDGDSFEVASTDLNAVYAAGAWTYAFNPATQDPIGSGTYNVTACAYDNATNTEVGAECSTNTFKYWRTVGTTYIIDSIQVGQLYEPQFGATDYMVGLFFDTLGATGDLRVDYSATSPNPQPLFGDIGAHWTMTSGSSGYSYDAIFQWLDVDVNNIVDGTSIAENELQPWYYDSGLGKWVPLAGTMQVTAGGSCANQTAGYYCVDTTNNTLTAWNITHFTDFTLGPAMQVEAEDITPSVAYPDADAGADIGILRLRFTNNLGVADTLTSITVRAKDTMDADVYRVGVYADTNGNGLFDSGTDALVTGSAEGAFTGGAYAQVGLTYAVPTGISYVFITYDVATGALGGRWLDAEIFAGDISLTTAGQNSAGMSPEGFSIIDDFGGSISIAAGATYTTTASVTLTQSATGASWMRFSNDGTAFTSPEAYNVAKAWTLPAGDGVKSVYVKYADALGQWSGAYSDTIILDTVAPNVALSYSADTVKDADTLTIWATFTEDPAGTPEIAIDTTGTDLSATVMTATGNPMVWTYSYNVPAASDGTATVTITVGADAAGNANNAATNATFTIDNTAPAGGLVTIEGGATYTMDQEVTLAITCPEASSTMSITGSIVDAAGVEACASPKTVTLTSGDALKTVTVNFWDAAGNVQAVAASDTITLDTTIPTLGALTFTTPTSDSTPTTSYSAGTDSNGILGYEVNLDGSGWIGNGTSLSYTPAALPDGNHALSVRAKDNAGNYSMTSVAIFYVDTVAPNVALSYSADTVKDADTLVITATFTEDPAGTPEIAINTTGTDLVATVMTATGNPMVWTYSYNVPAASDGTATVTITVGADAAGNANTAATNATFTIDNTAPSGSTVTINGGDAYTMTTNVTLSLISTGTEMNIDSTGWVTYATAYPWNVSTGDGIKTVSVQFRDAAGNTESAVTDTIILDTTAPTGTISIDAGALYATSTSVSVAYTAVDTNLHGTPVAFSNDGSSWSAWEASATPRAWTLTAGDEIKTVYLKVRDSAGNTTIFTDDIILDTVGPNVALSYSASTVKDADTLVITATFTEDPAGTPEMAINTTGTDLVATVMTATGNPMVWTYSYNVPAASDGTATVTITVGADAAGNANNAATNATFTIDNTAPSGSTVTINGGNAYTTTTNVTLSLVSTGTEMNIDSAGWATYESAYPWNVSTGDGIKTVSVQFRDAAGNVESAVTDTITLDTTAPTMGALTYTTPTTDNTPTITWVETAGTDTYEVNVDGSLWIGNGTTESYTTSALADGNHEVSVRALDVAGNASGASVALFRVDATAPIFSNGASNPTVGKDTTALTLTFNVNEALTANPTVTIGGQSATFSSLSGLTYTYTYTVDETPDTAGAKNLVITGTDVAGNTMTAQTFVGVVTYDFTAPSGSTVTINGGNAYTTTTNVTLSLASTGTEMNIDSTGWVTYESAYPWNVSTGDGIKTVSVQFRDAAGNVESAVTDTITLDTTIPTLGALTFTTPTADSTPTTSYSAGTDSNGILGYEVNLDGSGWIGNGTSLSYTPAALPDGNHALSVRAKDNAGNYSMTSVAIFYVDTVAPNVALSYSATTVKDADTLTIWATFTEDPAGTPEIAIDTTGTDLVATVMTATGNPKVWTYSYDVPAASDGTATVTITVGADEAGNANNAATNATFTIDNTAPAGGLVTIDGGATYTMDQEVTLAINCPEASSTMSITGSIVDAAGVEACASPKTVTLTSGDALKTVTVNFWDAAGNVQAVAASDTITLDTTIPTLGALTFTTPTADSTPTTSYSAGTDSNGIMGYEVNLDGSGWIGNGTSLSYTPAALPDGNHALSVRAKDNAGNYSMTSVAIFYVDTVAPNVALSYSADTVKDADTLTIWATFTEDPAGTPEIAINTTGTDLSATAMTATGNPMVWTYSYNVPAASDGTATVTITVGADAAGNANNAATNATFTIDNTVPAGGLVTIEGGATFTADQEVTLAITCPEASSTMSITGSIVGATGVEACTNNKTVTLTSGDALKTVTVNFWDAAGNVQAVAASDTITLDTTIPTLGALTFTTPTADSTPTTSYSAGTDSNGIMGYEVNLDGSGWIGNGTSLSYTPAALPDGNHALSVRAKDNAGNYSMTSVAIFTVDTAGPNVTISYSLTRDVKDADTLTVYATFDETPAGTPKIAIATAGNGDLAATSMTATGNAKLWIYAFNVPAGSDDNGTATVTITDGADSAGNTNTVATNNTFVIDNTAPTSSATAPSVGNKGIITVAYTASDTVSGVATVELWVKFVGSSESADWHKLTSYTTTDDSGNFSYVPSYGDGTYYFATRARDAAGNYEAVPSGSGDDATSRDTSAPDPSLLKVSTSLALNSSWPGENEDFTATFTIKNNDTSDISIEKLAVLVSGTLGTTGTRNFGTRSNLIIGAGQSYSYTSTRSISKHGLYRAQVGFYYNGTWYLADSGNLSVNSGKSAAKTFMVMLPDNTPIQGSGTKAYVISGTTKRHSPSLEIFRSRGYKVADIVIVTDAELGFLGKASALSYNKAYREGKAVQASGDTKAYVVEGGKLRYSPSLEIFKSRGFKVSEIVTISPLELSYFSLGSKLTYNKAYREGQVLQGSNFKAYVVEGGKLRYSPSLAIFFSNGYKISDIKIVSDLELSYFSHGANLVMK